MKKFIYFFQLYIVIYVLLNNVFGQHYGTVHSDNIAAPPSIEEICMFYNPEFQPLPETLDAAPHMVLVDWSSELLCNDAATPVQLAPQSALAISRGNCTYLEKVLRAQKLGAAALIVISDSGLSEPVASEASDYDKVNIPVVIVNKPEFEEFMSYSSDATIRLYAPQTSRVDYNMILIWLLAQVTVMVGSYWSGVVKYRQVTQQKRQSSKNKVDGELSQDNDAGDQQVSLDVSPQAIAMFVVLMCGMLVSLYFFYDYLVYIVILLFVFASSSALYYCTKPMLDWFGFCSRAKIPANRLPVLSQRPQIRHVVLALCCLGVGVFWCVERHAGYSWIIQDILGVVFCVHMMKTVQLPSLKVATILLLLLFVYDIFFVFVTPLITNSGQSVMVAVATGGGGTSGEMLPMVLKVPHFSSNSVCDLPYSLLGFGDILVPGLLISFLHGFDVQVQSHRVYYIATSIGYGVGLVVTFIALALMAQGQPALLYLVPSTLITAIVIGWKRGELSQLWSGKIATRHNKRARLLRDSASSDASDEQLLN